MLHLLYKKNMTPKNQTTNFEKQLNNIRGVFLLYSEKSNITGIWSLMILTIFSNYGGFAYFFKL